MENDAFVCMDCYDRGLLGLGFAGGGVSIVVRGPDQNRMESMRPSRT